MHQARHSSVCWCYDVGWGSDVGSGGTSPSAAVDVMQTPRSNTRQRTSTIVLVVVIVSSTKSRDAKLRLADCLGRSTAG